MNKANKEQREAIENIHGPLLILAGAGSGKTFTLVNRISFMIQQGISPENILAITFTNKAAEEMKERIAKTVGEHKASKIWASNFHKMGVRILKKHIEMLGTKHNRHFTIIDNEDSANIVKEIFKDMGQDPNENNYKHFSYTISRLKNEMVDYEFLKKNKPLYPYTDWKKSMEVYNEKIHHDFKKIFIEVFRRYEEYCEKYNVLDFDDLILNTVKLFHKNPELLEQYQEKFKYIMVDEYQDTNQAQYALLMMLAQKYRNFAVVGDDAQSIYKFRGSDMRNILNFKKDFPDAKIIQLKENYRSTDVIVKASNSLIAHNKEQYKKETFSRRKDDFKVQKLVFYFDDDVVDYIANYIENKVKHEGYRYKDFAILYRSNYESGPFERIFIKRNIPHKIYGAFPFFKREEVMNVLAYLKFIVNPNDMISLNRIINLPKRGIGDQAKEIIFDYIADNGVNEFINNPSGIDGLSEKQVESLKDFAKKILYFQSASNKKMPNELIEEVIRDFKLIEEIKQRKINEEEKVDRINNISDLVNFAVEYGSDSIQEFLDEFTLYNEKTEDDEGDNISLMTAHYSKGLEFDNVFIIGLEERNFPHFLSIRNDDVNEERRLAYVAMTRAKNKLFLCAAEAKSVFGRTKYCTPSRFLDEIDKKYIEETTYY